MSVVVKEGHVECKLIFKDFLIVSGKSSAPLKGDSSREGVADTHTSLLLLKEPGGWIQPSFSISLRTQRYLMPIQPP